MKIIKIYWKYRSGREVGDNPTTSHTPGEPPAPLADLADLAPNSVKTWAWPSPFATIPPVILNTFPAPGLLIPMGWCLSSTLVFFNSPFFLLSLEECLLSSVKFCIKIRIRKIELNLSIRGHTVPLPMGNYNCTTVLWKSSQVCVISTQQ